MTNSKGVKAVEYDPNKRREAFTPEYFGAARFWPGGEPLLCGARPRRKNGGAKSGDTAKCNEQAAPETSPDMATANVVLNRATPRMNSRQQPFPGAAC